MGHRSCKTRVAKGSHPVSSGEMKYATLRASDERDDPGTFARPFCDPVVTWGFGQPRSPDLSHGMRTPEWGGKTAPVHGSGPCRRLFSRSSRELLAIGPRVPTPAARLAG